VYLSSKDRLTLPQAADEMQPGAGDVEAVDEARSCFDGDPYPSRSRRFAGRLGNHQVEDARMPPEVGARPAVAVLDQRPQLAVCQALAPALAEGARNAGRRRPRPAQSVPAAASSQGRS
jgi:hypothetical protein